MLPPEADPFEIDPRDPAFLADPHAVYDALRPEQRLVTDPIGWSAITYAGCDAAFHDPALVPGIDPLLEQLGFGPLWGTAGRTLTDSEGADHSRLRRVVSPWFTARRIAAMRDRTRDLVDAQLGAHDPSEPLELVGELVDVVPARLFCWMVGAGDEDDRTLADWSKDLLLVFTATEAMVEPVRRAKAELADYTHALLDHKRTHPGDDLASVLAQAASAGTIDELDAFCLLEELLSASVDNTANTAGLALHALAGDPAAWSLLHRDQDVVAVAVEELGRYQPAIRHTIKYAVADTVVDGTSVAAGEFVTIRIAAAHRDPDVYPDPHALDVARPLPAPQLAFGAGRHYCLGAALGRMELQEMVGGVTRRWPGATVADGASLSINAAGLVHRLPLDLEVS